MRRKIYEVGVFLKDRAWEERNVQGVFYERSRADHADIDNNSSPVIRYISSI